MTAVVLRGLRERRLRSILTALAVVLGVAMISGTFVTTDGINHAFGKIEESAYKGVDAVVTPRTAFHSQYAEPKPFSGALVDRIRSLPGVRLAQGELDESGQLVVRGAAVNNTFAPSLVISTAGAEFSQVRPVSGRMPSASGEIAIDAHTATRQRVAVGDTVGVAARTGVKRVRVVGICTFGGGTSIGGATLIFAGLGDVQRWYSALGQVTSVMVASSPGISPKRLIAEIRPLLPAGLRVRTGQAEANQVTRDVTGSIGSFLTPMLLALGGAALLVGAFIIFNTFSITVAQRTREFALLRSLGASRRQVLAAVAGEAVAMGTVASVLGLFGGLGFATLLGALFDAAGFGIPRSGLTLAPRTIAVALGIGVLVTLAGATGPALRAMRVPPVAAMQAADAGSRGRSRWAPYVAVLVNALGLALVIGGLFAGGAATTRLTTIGAGVVVIFIGMTLSARWFVRPLASVLGLPVALAFGEPGRLARENAMRNPSRTATTSAALMVGLGLVVFVSVFAAGLQASAAHSLDRYLRADYIVSSPQSQPLPAGAGTAIAQVGGVSSSSALYVDQIKVGANQASSMTDTLHGVDAGGLRRLYTPEWIRGSDLLLGHLGARQALIEQQFATAHKLVVGQDFTVTTPSGGHATLRAVGEYRDPQVLPGVIVDAATFRAVSSSRDPFAWFVKRAPGAAAVATKTALARAVRPFPPAKVQTLGEYKQTVKARLNQIVYLLYALLAMSLVIALFGIANSLLLSIHERTREFGLLRAVGATRAQVRRIVRYESVITALIGGLLGMIVGVVFAALVTAALRDLGLSFSLPIAQLIVFLALAVVVGVLGAVGPARRGARVDVLVALRLR